MAVQPRGQQPETGLQWLEEELREAKARLHKVEHELDQALKQVWSLEADQRKLAEALSAAAPNPAQASAVKEELRQLRDQVNRVQDRQTALVSRTEELLRQRQSETGRDHQDRSNLAKGFEALAKEVARYESRIQALEEASHRIDEEVAGLRLAGQTVTRDMEELSSRTARALEATVRLEHALGRATGDIEAAAKQDGVLSERLNLLQEQLRRHGELLEKLEAISTFPAEVRELLQRERFEREQLTGRMAALEHMSGELAGRVQEFVQGLARLQQRDQTQSGQLLQMSEELRELAQQTRGQVKRLFQVFLRQRRRQVDALSQEIKELSQSELNSGE